jgi:hypothetical protein
VPYASAALAAFSAFFIKALPLVLSCKPTARRSVGAEVMPGILKGNAVRLLGLDKAA